MATSDTYTCNICTTQYLTSVAIVWCPECEENFCEKCLLHHSVAKATKRHETIEIEKVTKLPQFVRDIEASCSEHDERFIYFCSEHQVPCCVKCLKPNHSNCRNLTAIQNIVQDVKSSASFTDLETLVEDILTSIGNMTKDRTEYRELLGTMKSKFVLELKATRDAIDDYLDKLEHQLTLEMEQSVYKEETEIEKILHDLSSRKEKVCEFQGNLGLIKSHASDFQTFFAMREMIKLVTKEEQELQMLLEGNTLSWITFTLQPMDFKGIEENWSSLGKLYVQANPCKLKWVVCKVKEAQLIGNISHQRNVMDIQLVNIIDVSLPSPKGRKVRKS